MRYGLTVLLSLLVTAAAMADPVADATRRAEELLRQAKATRGLCVYVGADTALAAALARRGMYVHVLASGPAEVRAARAALAKTGLYGERVAVEMARPGRLPHADNVVNLLVSDSAAAAALKLPPGEVLRVLAPDAVAVVGEKVTRKPRPDGMGEWSHPRHGADGNPVATDTLVGPSRQIRWLAGPLWGHHRGPVGAVAAGGRLYYVLRQQPLGTNVMPRYFLTARDAYNGLLLWKRQVPGQQFKRWPPYRPAVPDGALVAGADRVFAVLTTGGPLTALDGRTGRELKAYTETPSPESVYFARGTLVLARRTDLHAIDAGSGKLLWKHAGTLTRSGHLTAGSVLVAGGKVFFRRQATRKPVQLAAVGLRTGRESWSIELATLKPKGRGDPHLMLCYDGVIVLRGSAGVYAVGADGEQLWHRPGPAGSAFGLRGRIWLQGKTAPKGAKYKYGWTAVDARTGREHATVAVPSKLPAGIRGKRILDGQCNYPVATPNYFVTTTRMSLLDSRTGEFHNTMITRGPCKFLLAIPANGLLYTFPKDCVCYPCLRGTMAYAPATDPPRPSHPLEEGPAFGEPLKAAPATPTDWPTYRGDPQRSGSTASPMPGRLDVLWTVDLGARASAPVVSGGLAYVASIDRHELHARQAATGEKAWTFTAGGRIDSPPTIIGGLCVFGSRDGWVQALRADDGRLVWRRRAAPAERRIVAFGQPESPWPAFGSVLASGPNVYASAGHHANAAGGISVLGLEAATGRLLWRNAPTYECVNNVLSLTPGGKVHLAYYKIAFDPKTGRPAAERARLRSSAAGFLNDETVRVLPVFDAARVVNVYPGKLKGKKRQPNVPGEGYEVTLSRIIKGAKPQRLWQRPAVPVRVNSVVLSAGAVFVAGGSDAAYDSDAKNPWAALDGEIGGKLLAFSAADGSEVATVALDAPTVRDGLAAANGRLYAVTKSGRVYCLGRK